ncbi:MAG: hypothetical protein ACD_11C00103G0045 [uncultured bacterium]|nr:MAG: hypothetical protein ACD_11C00103G0045 [uncultured bacterium]HBR71457.1 hypothetical protein [Candidatus Moranbacteria bacterium]
MFIGNKKALSFIEKTLAKGSFSQTYIFSGPEAVGKFFLAKVFAVSLINDSALDFDFNFQEKSDFDLIVIAPEIEEKKGITKEKIISIEKIREVQKQLALFPNYGKRKVLVIDNAHKMNISAQNALLKILEEPNSTSIIILVTHEEGKILPTIKSRCQKINFGLVSGDEIMEMQNSYDPDAAKDCVLLSMGRPGFFVDMINNKEKLDFYREARESLGKIRSMDLNERLILADKISKNIYSTIKIMNVWIWILRKNALEKMDVFAVGKNYEIIEKIEETISVLKNTNVSGRLVLENLLINI